MVGSATFVNEPVRAHLKDVQLDGNIGFSPGQKSTYGCFTRCAPKKRSLGLVPNERNRFGVLSYPI